MYEFIIASSFKTSWKSGKVLMMHETGLSVYEVLQMEYRKTFSRRAFNIFLYVNGFSKRKVQFFHALANKIMSYYSLSLTFLLRWYMTKNSNKHSLDLHLEWNTFPWITYSISTENKLLVEGRNEFDIQKLLTGSTSVVVTFNWIVR